MDKNELIAVLEECIEDIEHYIGPDETSAKARAIILKLNGEKNG